LENIDFFHAQEVVDRNMTNAHGIGNLALCPVWMTRMKAEHCPVAFLGGQRFPGRRIGARGEVLRIVPLDEYSSNGGSPRVQARGDLFHDGARRAAG